jgi:hypothetical protein
MAGSCRRRPTQERDTVGRQSNRIQHPNSTESSALEHADELAMCCAQAIAIAALLMEADTDQPIQDSAWAIRCLVERARRAGESLVQFASRDR